MDDIYTIRSKDHFRDIVVRNGRFLPSSTFADLDYLYGVVQGSRWAPLYDELKMRPCPRPPPK